MKEKGELLFFIFGGFGVDGHFLVLAIFYRKSAFKRGAEVLGAKWILGEKWQVYYW